MRTVRTSDLVVATGAAINIELGYKPDWVKVTNMTDGEEIYWQREMTNLGTPIFGIKRLATGVSSQLATAGVGIADYVGADEDGSGSGKSVGFTIGATAGVNVNTEELIWEAGFDDK